MRRGERRPEGPGYLFTEYCKKALRPTPPLGPPPACLVANQLSSTPPATLPASPQHSPLDSLAHGRAVQPSTPPGRPANSRAAQLASSHTSLEALETVQERICSARASDYIHWKRKRPQEPRKSVSSLVGHIQSAIRQIFESCAEQQLVVDVKPKVPFVVLLGWLAEKLNPMVPTSTQAKSFYGNLPGMNIGCIA